MIKNFKILFLVSLTFIACNNNDEEAIVANSSDGLPLTAGDANFSKFVALGDSYSAGYSDGALFIEGQKGSFVNIMAQQFALVGGGDFKTPFMADNIGGFKIGGTQFQGPRLYFNGVAPVPVPGTPTTEILNPAVAAAGPYNNCGVPGAKSFHLLSSGYGSAAGLLLGTASPYYARFASQTAPNSILGYAMAQTPTFFSLWIGGNDVLGYALSGGDGSSPITPSAGPAGVGFDATYDALVNTLTSAGAKGVTGNIPYVNTIPHFTFVATNPVPLVAAQIAQLNPLFSAMNSMLASVGQAPRFKTLTASSTNPLLIADEMQAYDATALFTAAFQGAPFNYPLANASFLGALYGKARHASNTTGSRDYIVLSQAGLIGTNKAGYPPTNSTIGVTYPMEDSATLTASEVALIKTATDAYNVKIKAKATEKGLAFVDLNALMSQLANGGITANSYTVTDKFVTGGGFSLDGVHASPRGYALFANKFIEAINAKYKSNLKGVSLYDYRILFPRTL